MQAVPVDGNKGGSLITMYSSKGLQFGWIFFASCFGWVWADQGFWQSAIAARPSAAYKCGPPGAGAGQCTINPCVVRHPVLGMQTKVQQTT
jgi:hypothetical protein